MSDRVVLAYSGGLDTSVAIRWLKEKLPASKLYGPYNHGGRHYYQWMARGQALKEHLLPILMRHLDIVDDHVRGRIEDMIRDYSLSV